MKKILLVASFALFITACSTIPYTNRTAVNRYSEQEEINMGTAEFEKLKAESPIITGTPEAEMIQRAGKRIAAAAEKPSYRWEFILIDGSSTVNAFCLPGGKVAFYTGILPVCRDENGIAVVMGHEVAHAFAHHGAERMTQGEIANLAGTALSAALNKESEKTRNLALGAYGVTAQLGVMLPFSRKHESEADFIGTVLIAKAGYDPEHAVEFWQRMSAQSKGGGGGTVSALAGLEGFLSTHPSDKTRIEDLKIRMPEIRQYYKP